MCHRPSRNVGDPPTATRQTDEPPRALQDRYAAAPGVSGFADGAVRQRVINCLHHTQPWPAAHNALLLLLGEPYARSALGGYTPVRRGSNHHRHAVAELPDTHQQEMLLVTFEMFPTPAHADLLLTIADDLRDASLETAYLRTLVGNIAFKLSATQQVPADARWAWRQWLIGAQLARLDGLHRLIQHAGFRAITAQQRAKVLWVLEMCTVDAHEKLRLLLAADSPRFHDATVRCRPAMPSDITRPILSVDFASAPHSQLVSLLDHLYAIARAGTGHIADAPPVVPAPRGGGDVPAIRDYVLAAVRNARHTRSLDFTSREINKGDLVANLVCEVADPDGAMNQGMQGTCPITSILNRLAHIRPAEYAYIARSLIFDNEVKFEWNADRDGDQRRARARYCRDHFAQNPANLALVEGRWDRYADEITTMRLPTDPVMYPRPDKGEAWNVATGRSVTERMVQQTFTEFVNRRTPEFQRDSRSQNPTEGMAVCDAVLLTINLLHGTSFVLHMRDLREQRVARGLLGIPTRTGCIASNDAAGWLRELRADERAARADIFLAWLWAPEEVPFNGSVPADGATMCPNADESVLRWSSRGRHMVQWRGTTVQPHGYGNDKMVLFWNPWGLMDVDPLFNRGVRDPSGNTDWTESAVAPDHPAPHTQYGSTSTPIRTVLNRGWPRGTMAVTDEEFERDIEGYFCLDPV